MAHCGLQIGAVYLLAIKPEQTRTIYSRAQDDLQKIKGLIIPRSCTEFSITGYYLIIGEDRTGKIKLAVMILMIRYKSRVDI